MFSYTYKYKMNPAKSTIKLSPTFGTYVKAFGPTVVLVGGLFLIGTISEFVENRKKNDTTDPHE